MKAIIELWKTGEYTEDTVVQTLKCSYATFRSMLIEHGEALPERMADGVHEEIYREYQSGVDERYDDAEWIANTYGMSKAAALRYRRDRPKSVQLTGYTDTDIVAHLKAGFTPEAVAFLLGCSSNRVRKNLKPLKKEITEQVKESVLEALAKGEPHKRIALSLGISESMVSKLNPNKTPKPKRPPLSDEAWEQLKVSMSRYSVSELARMYNISRAYIYGRLAKEKAA